MTTEQETVLMIKGVISELPNGQQAICWTLIKDVKNLLDKVGEPYASLAIALIGAEKQVENT